jgi:hypothetical protein
MVWPFLSAVGVAQETLKFQFSTPPALAVRVRRRFKPPGICIARAGLACWLVLLLML